MTVRGRIQRQSRLTPEMLVRAYAAGIFPMAETRDDPTVYWIDPDERGILPFDSFHVPRSLRKTVRRGLFEVRIDTAFRAVIEACAEPAPGRRDTWINSPILDAYTALHELGITHSVECWQDGDLVGGLYGVALGGVFFGESMFSRRTDASKVALVHLVGRLRADGFRLLDIQFLTEHLAHFGAITVTRGAYLALLDEALDLAVSFRPEPLSHLELEAFLQSTTQTS
jgi:leucyl/phenylalanyl-tRNA--protein transferase